MLDRQYNLATYKTEKVEDVTGLARSHALMTAVDRINQMMGIGTIKLLAEGTDQRWAMKAEKRTPRYTTRLDVRWSGFVRQPDGEISNGPVIVGLSASGGRIEFP